MRRGNSLLITSLAVVGVTTVIIGWFSWPITPKITDYGETNPRNSEYRPGGSQCEPKALASVRDAAERLSKADTCAKEVEEYRQQTADLIQQTRAADAAKAQAQIASQQLWIGWLQTLGGILTLAAAVGAAIYARAAAASTEGQLTLTRDQHKRTVEPRVTVIQVNAPSNPNERWFEVIVKNDGLSAALKTRVAANATLYNVNNAETEIIEWQRNDILIDETCEIIPQESRPWRGIKVIIDEMFEKIQFEDGVFRKIIFNVAWEFESEFGEKITIKTDYVGRIEGYWQDNVIVPRIGGPLHSIPGTTVESREHLNKKR